MPSRPSSPSCGQRSRGNWLLRSDLVGARGDRRVGRRTHRLGAASRCLRRGQSRSRATVVPPRLASCRRAVYCPTIGGFRQCRRLAKRRADVRAGQAGPVEPLFRSLPTAGGHAIEQKILDAACAPAIPADRDRVGGPVRGKSLHRAGGPASPRERRSRGTGQRVQASQVTRPGHAETASRVSRALTSTRSTFHRTLGGDAWRSPRAPPRWRGACRCRPHSTRSSRHCRRGGRRGSERPWPAWWPSSAGWPPASGNRVLQMLGDATGNAPALPFPASHESTGVAPGGRSRIVVARRRRRGAAQGKTRPRRSRG